MRKSQGLSRRGRGRGRMRKTIRTPPDLSPDDTLEMLNGHDDVVGRCNLFAVEDGKLATVVHGHSLTDLYKAGGRRGELYIIIRVHDISPSHKHEKYPYKMLGTESPTVIGDLCGHNNYVWDKYRLRKVAATISECKTVSHENSLPLQRTRDPPPKPVSAAAAKHRSNETPPSNTYAHPMHPGDLERDTNPPVPPKGNSGLKNQEAMDMLVMAASTVDAEDENSPTLSPAPLQKDIGSPKDVRDVTSAPIHDSKRNKNEGDGGHFTDEEIDMLPSTVTDEQHILGGEEDETEAEGDEIDVPDTTGKGTYVKTHIRVRVDQLVYPPNTTRALDVHHVGKVKASLRNGWNYSLGYITVCHKPSVKEFTPVQYPEDKFKDLDMDEKPLSRNIEGRAAQSLKAYFVVNGMHRGNATDRMFREVEDRAGRQEFGVVHIMLISRSDGKELSFYELLALGGRENDIGVIATKPPTFADQIQLCVSCVKEIWAMHPNIEVTAVGLGKRFQEDCLIRATAKETHRRYARVALTFASRPKVYERFLKYWNKEDGIGKKLRASHLQSILFHTKFNESQQLLIIDALYEFLVQSSTTYFTPPAARSFCIECRDLFDIVEQFAAKKKITAEVFLNESVTVTKKQSVSVAKSLLRTVTNFCPTENLETMNRKSGARVKKFRENLAQSFFPKTEEQKRREAEDRRNRREAMLKEAEERIKKPRAAKRKAITATAELATSLKGKTTSKVTGKRRKADNGLASVQYVKKQSLQGFQYVLKNVATFDDKIPSRYPNKYCIRPPKWTGPKNWVELITVPPHRLWSKELRVLHPEPWLHALGVPRKHRSHIFLSESDLERNHHAVFFHAAIQGALQRAIASNPLYKGPDTRSEEDSLTRAQRVAIEHPELSEVFLASCRERVINKGYCVIEGIFNDRKIPPADVKTIYDRDLASTVMDFYMSRLPSEGGIRNKVASNKFWAPTFNNTTDAEKHLQETGQGLFMTTREGLFEHTEKSDATVEVARCRAALDVRALQICAAMGFEEAGSRMLAIPCTGCRLFTSTANCERQTPHTVFKSESATRESFSPMPSVDYSVIWTANDATPILLWEYSHVLQGGTPIVSKKVSQDLHAKRVMIPQFSSLIIRGDLLHVGPGWQDQTLAENVIRWGINVADRRERLTDAPVVPANVSFVEHFQPSVQHFPSWIPDPMRSRFK